MTRVWNGDTPIAARIADGSIDLHGPKALARAFPGWLMLNMFAGIPPATAG
jgi:hypothetical protein